MKVLRTVHRRPPAPTLSLTVTARAAGNSRSTLHEPAAVREAVLAPRRQTRCPLSRLRAGETSRSVTFKVVRDRERLAPGERATRSLRLVAAQSTNCRQDAYLFLHLVISSVSSIHNSMKPQEVQRYRTKDTTLNRCGPAGISFPTPPAGIRTMSAP